MRVRGIRGAVTVETNEEQPILEATLEMMRSIVTENALDPEDICSVLITVTTDLDATFPAKAIRLMDGWDFVPLMCALEMPVKGSLDKCIRLMVHVNTERSQNEIKHVYLRRAQALRPDLSGLTSN